jgi:hypothetical protein
MKYRKKPVVIDAVYWDGSWDGFSVVANAMCISGQDDERIMLVTNSGGVPTNLAIPTLEGEMLASPGDWIIKGIKGEFYPCKPDIFAATYEPA